VTLALSWMFVGAAVLIVPGWSAVGRVAGRAVDDGLPLVLDLAAAGLRSGQPLSVAVALAAGAGPAPLADLLTRVAALDGLGAAPAEAWSCLPRDGPLGEVARVAVRSADSGSRLAAGFERLAAEIRAERAAEAAVRAHRAAVFTVAPLAACFLPSFVCLGVIPVVIGVARQVLGGVRGVP
jgi:Flp pilus assembly protein TadB